ncbi:MAG: S28 family serine protease [Bacteroidota bacterium]
MGKPVSFLLLSLIFILSCSKQVLQSEKISARDSEQLHIEAFLFQNKLDFEVIRCDTNHFKKAFKLFIEQPIDHAHPEKGSFKQKVYLSHRSKSANTVLYLNGYSASGNAYVTEATKLLDANQLHVEHRYFNESIPKDMDPQSMFGEDNEWRTYLTIEQAAADHHRIVQLMNKFYGEKWLSTGISKGGQATIFHKRFYPADIDASIPYVAPINLEREDPRIEAHLNSIGSSTCREKIFRFQKSLLENRSEVLKLFEEESAKRNYTYLKSANQSLELSVLEFEFAFWQWSGDCDAIPDESAPLKKRMNFLFQIDAPGFFTTDIIPINAFFYQGYNQIGMYGYDIDPFGHLIRTFEEDVDNQDVFLEGIEMPDYDSDAVPEVVEWLNDNGNDLIYIVGELDPWGSTAIIPTEKTNSLNFTLKNGNHSTRIVNLSLEERNQICDSLEVWLDLKRNLDANDF